MTKIKHRFGKCKLIAGRRCDLRLAGGACLCVGYGASFSEGTDLYNVALFISFMYLMCEYFASHG